MNIFIDAFEEQKENTQDYRSFQNSENNSGQAVQKSKGNCFHYIVEDLTENMNYNYYGDKGYQKGNGAQVFRMKSSIFSNKSSRPVGEFDCSPNAKYQSSK